VLQRISFIGALALIRVKAFLGQMRLISALPPFKDY
jgi:hypothetical protein